MEGMLGATCPRLNHALLPFQSQTDILDLLVPHYLVIPALFHLQFSQSDLEVIIENVQQRTCWLLGCWMWQCELLERGVSGEGDSEVVLLALAVAHGKNIVRRLIPPAAVCPSYNIIPYQINSNT